MNKQKICVIGDGLSGLMTAIAISQLEIFEVFLVSKKASKKTDKRTTAISETNFKFLKENLKNLNSKFFWPSKKIELYYESNEKKVNFLNLNERLSNLMYVFENDKIKNVLLKEIIDRKIKVIRKEIKNTKELKRYDLTILCLGGSSKIYDKAIKDNPIVKDYNEVAITAYVRHKIKNINTSQFFLKQGPLAILPFSKEKFSFVWSLNKDFYKSISKDIGKFVKHKIQEILKTKKKISISNIQSYPITLGLKRKYYHKNILILGEGLHTIHPIAGQGFNLVLRDIKKLKDILKYYSDLGISIENSYALKDFYNSRKPENIIMGLGVDVTHTFFKENKYFEPLKNVIIKNIGKNETLKKFSKIISNKGLSF